MPMIQFVICLLLGSTLFFSSAQNAQADESHGDPMNQNSIRIEDPQSWLQRIPLMSRSTDWSRAFTCQRPLKFFMNSSRCKIQCRMGVCKQTCTSDSVSEQVFQAEDCLEDSVHLYSTLGYDWAVTRSDYISSRYTILRTLIQQLPNYIEPVKLVQIKDFIYPVPVKFIENGQMKSIMAAMIILNLFPDGLENGAVPVSIYLNLEADGIDQLLCWGFDQSCISNSFYLMKRKGLIVNGNN